MLFLGHSPCLNFSWELWSRSSLNDKKRWFTVRDEIRCPKPILTNLRAACKTFALCWYPISFSATFCKNTGLTEGDCCHNCMQWPHIIKKQKWGEEAWLHRFMQVPWSTGWCSFYRDLRPTGRNADPAGRRAYHWPVQWWHVERNRSKDVGKTPKQNRFSVLYQKWEQRSSA